MEREIEMAFIFMDRICIPPLIKTGCQVGGGAVCIDISLDLMKVWLQ